MCRHSENPSVWRWGHGVVARTSKHILLFAFDPLSLNFISHISCIALYCTYSYVRSSLYVCPYLCWTKRASYITSTLNLEEIVQSPSPGIRLHSLVTHSVLQLSFNSTSFVIRLASTHIHPPLGVFQLSYCSIWLKDVLLTKIFLKTTPTLTSDS